MSAGETTQRRGKGGIVYLVAQRKIKGSGRSHSVSFSLQAAADAEMPLILQSVTTVNRQIVDSADRIIWSWHPPNLLDFFVNLPYDMPHFFDGIHRS